MLVSDLCDYSKTYIVVKGEISIKGIDYANKRNQKLIFKTNASFRPSISKIKNTFTDNAEVCDIAIAMYNFNEYSDNYSMTFGSLWNYYRDEVADRAFEINHYSFRTNNNNTITSRSFVCKTKITAKTLI